ncbi:hypothetical protein [Micromonospora sp. CA-248212]|uniref:hypothetical protein n=1 Tax=Micromonospora sp. CA-248212 TaxID=3239961 RepID=UPI003D8EDBD4
MNGTLTRESSADLGTGYRLTKAAANQAKTVLGFTKYEEVAQHMGISRRSFFRLLSGNYPISLNQAADFCDLIGWPLAEAFQRGEQ